MMSVFCFDILGIDETYEYVILVHFRLVQPYMLHECGLVFIAVLHHRITSNENFKVKSEKP